MTLSRTFTASLILHLAVFLLLYRLALTGNHPPEPVVTTRWTIDLATALLAEDPREPGARNVSAARDVTPDTWPPDPGAVPANGAAALLPAREEAVDAAEDGAAAARAEPGPQAGTESMAQAGQAIINAMTMQAVIVKTGHYYAVTGRTLKGMLESALPYEERRRLEGCTGTVVVSYGSGDRPDSFAIDATDDQFRTALNDTIRWEALSAPRNYLLPHTKVTFSIRVANGRVGVGIALS
ncbi:MAG: hypothetical protein ED859_14540 [Desulfuromonadales bacterium]|nr:MAG: hypothetical protein ED859_14540 [Desulfuromonadales bacterium]